MSGAVGGRRGPQGHAFAGQSGGQEGVVLRADHPYPVHGVVRRLGDPAHNGIGVAGGESVMIDRAHLKAEAFSRLHLGCEVLLRATPA